MALDENFFIKAWYKGNPVYYLLIPLTWFFCLVSFIRRKLYAWGLLPKFRSKVPVIIVGNITVGGTGKTPLIIALANKLGEMGYKPGIISRGFGGKSPVWPLSVTAKSNPIIVGDEPVMIARQVNCPVVVGPDRGDDCEALLHRYPDCNVILSDDGLQHYALERDIEIAVIDGRRCMGNKYCLPAGPLREPKKRLKQVDEVVVNGGDYQDATRMEFIYTELYDIDEHERTAKLSDFKGQKVHAVAAIGNPDEFFASLREAGLEVIEHVFDDHYDLEESDVKFAEDYPIIVTEKDAVKLELYHPHDIWVLPVKVAIDDEFYQRIFYKLQELIPESRPAAQNLK